jgi:hypothetical protein
MSRRDLYVYSSLILLAAIAVFFLFVFPALVPDEEDEFAPTIEYVL